MESYLKEDGLENANRALQFRTMEINEVMKGPKVPNEQSLILYHWIYVDFIDLDGTPRIRMYGIRN